MEKCDKRAYSSKYWLIISSLIALFIAFNITPTFAASFKKLKTSGSHPSGRSTPSVAALGKYVYLFGGIRDDYSTGVNTFYNDLYRFNTETNTWEMLSPKGEAPAPRSLAIAMGDIDHNRILILGGIHYGKNFSNMTMYSDIWSYSPSSNTWTKIIQKNKGPETRGAQKAWYANNKIYVFGGNSPSFTLFNDTWVFDLTTNTWKELIANKTPDSPPARREAMAANSPSDLVIYGGMGLDQTNNMTTFNDTWEFNLKTNKWLNVTPANDKNISPPHTDSSVAIIGNNMYMQGGDLKGVGETTGCGAPFPQSANDDLWRFDLNSHVWDKLGASGDSLPRLKRGSGVAVNGKMYIFSGYDFQCYGKGPGQLWDLNVYTLNPQG